MHTQCSKSYSPSPCIGQCKYWWGRCLPCQTNDAVRHRAVQWRAPLGQDQSEPGSRGEPEPVIVLLETEALRQRAKRKLWLVKRSNKTWFWYQVMHPQPPHRSYFQQPASVCVVVSNFIFMFLLCQFPQYCVDCVGCLINTSVETTELISLIIHWYSQANKQISMTHVLLGKVCDTPRANQDVLVIDLL